MAQKVGYRQFLNDAGYKDDEIGYDPSGRVTLQGKTFAYATPEADHKTYGDFNDLTSALRNFRSDQNQNKLSQLTDNMMQQATAQQPFQYKVPTPFTFDPSTNLQYQQALKATEGGIQTAQNNTLAKLRATGQGKSSYSETLANQIAQNAYGKLNTELLPQMYREAYQQWADQAGRDYQAQRDQYAAGQDQFGNLSALAGMLADLGQRDADNRQRELDNQFRTDQAAEQRRRGNIADALDLTNIFGVPVMPKDSGQVLFDQVAGLSPLNTQQFQYGKEQDAINNALKQQMQNAQIGNMAADNARQNRSLSNSEENTRVSRLVSIWEQTGAAPAGLEMYGVRKGAPLGSSKQPTADDYIKQIDNSTFISKESTKGMPDESGNTTSADRVVVYDKPGLKQYIDSLGLPNGDMFKLYKRYNIDTTGLDPSAVSDAEIDKFLK